MSNLFSAHRKAFSDVFLRESVLVFFALILAALLIASLAISSTPFRSSELRFTDASASGLSIMPASCPSSPHYTGACDGTPPPTPTSGCVMYREPGITTASAGSRIAWATSYCPSAGYVSAGESGCQSMFDVTTSISPGVGTVAMQGTSMVHPSVTTTYTLTASYYMRGKAQPPTEIRSCSTTVEIDGSGGTCTPTYFCSGNNLYYRNAACAETLSQNCSYGCSGGACVNGSTPSATLTVVPLLVHTGATTQVSWTSNNVSSCTVTGTNGDGTGASPWSGTSGTRTSSAITAQVTYTMNCTGNDSSTITQSATVNIIPFFCETGVPGCP